MTERSAPPSPFASLRVGRVRLAPFVRRAFWTAVITANLTLVAITIYGLFVSDLGYDWLIYVEAGERARTGRLFEWEAAYAWSYSPLLAYAFALLAPIGYLGWSALHVVAAFAVGDRRLAAITLLSWPFWIDLYNGNTMTFVFVAAVGVVRGNRPATVCYLALCLLMPRPVMLPLLAWLLWRQPWSRVWFAGVVTFHTLGVLATGQGTAWIEALFRVGEAVVVSSRDVGPSRLIGSWWLPIGAALAVVFAVRGRLGWASVTVSPYWLPQYLLMLLLEFVPTRVPRSQEPG